MNDGRLYLSLFRNFGYGSMFFGLVIQDTPCHFGLESKSFGLLQKLTGRVHTLICYGSIPVLVPRGIAVFAHVEDYILL